MAWAVKAAEAPLAFKPGDGQAEAWLDANVQRHPRRPGGKATLLLPQRRAWTDPQDAADAAPCVADPLGGYRGLENQLYRVEIHTVQGGGDTATATFKWSRENGSVVAAWTGQSGTALTVEGVHDTAHGFAAGQWVDLSDEVGQRLNLPGVMVKLVKVEQNTLTYDPASASGAIPVLAQLVNPIVRRWDQRESKDYALTGGAIPLTEGTAYTLEYGIKVQFAGLKPRSTYEPGDYWVIPARTALGDVEWPAHTVAGTPPQQVADAREPAGVGHAYCPLALVTPTGNTADPFTIATFQRTIIPLWGPA